MCKGNVTNVTHVTLAGFLKIGSVTHVTNVMSRRLETEEPNPPSPFPAGEGGDFITRMRVGQTLKVSQTFRVFFFGAGAW